jgi:hypothetical protein
MKIDRRLIATTTVVLVLAGAGAFWATSSSQASIVSNTFPLPKGPIGPCGGPDVSGSKTGTILGLNFQTLGTSAAATMFQAGNATLGTDGKWNQELITTSIGGHAEGDGIGGTDFALDTSPGRQVKGSMNEELAGAGFPITSTVRFHFVFTADAFPGKVFRSMTPAAMRSTHVTAMPPPSGTVYNLVAPVPLEDVSHPGVMVGQILTNHVVVP